MKRLYIDFDGVVMDTIDKIYEELIKVNKNINTQEEIDEFYINYDFSKVVNDNNILNDSINRINNLIKTKKFEISFLTHVNTIDEGIVKIEYLRERFKNISVIIVPKKISKTKAVHSKDAILIDDSPTNLAEWENNGGIAIRFSKQLESSRYKVINYLDDILKFDDILK